MNNQAISRLLRPYFDKNILGAFDDAPVTYAAHEQHVADVARGLEAKFCLPSFTRRAAWSYRPEYSFTIWLNREQKPVPARGDGPSYDLDTDVHYFVDLEISLKGPFITFTSWRRPMAGEAPQAWHFNREVDLYTTVKPWIDWLCASYGLTYIPSGDLDEDVPDRFNDCSSGPATLYSMMFRET
jgi:hypothetical protein